MVLRRKTKQVTKKNKISVVFCDKHVLFKHISGLRDIQKTVYVYLNHFHNIQFRFTFLVCYRCANWNLGKSSYFSTKTNVNGFIFFLPV